MKNKDINMIAKLLPALAMTKQGANLESISLVEGATIELTFQGGECWTVHTGKPPETHTEPGKTHRD